MLNYELELTANIDFIIQLTVIMMFTTMLFGFVIKKFMQIMKG